MKNVSRELLVLGVKSLLTRNKLLFTMFKILTKMMRSLVLRLKKSLLRRNLMNTSREVQSPKLKEKVERTSKFVQKWRIFHLMHLSRKMNQPVQLKKTQEIGTPTERTTIKIAESLTINKRKLKEPECRLRSYDIGCLAQCF